MTDQTTERWEVPWDRDLLAPGAEVTKDGGFFRVVAAAWHEDAVRGTAVYVLEKIRPELTADEIEAQLGSELRSDDAPAAGDDAR